ncbi:MAG: ArsR family transcriptional regulator [Bacteroidota bacterium]
MRNLEDEFGESTNAIRLELNKFEKSGLLVSSSEGNKKIFRVNISHHFFKDIQNLIMKVVGLDQIIDYVIKRLGEVKEVYLVGKFARGLDSDIIDLVFVGKIDKNYLLELVEKAEKKINKKVRYVIFSPEEFDIKIIKEDTTEPLLLWCK